MAISNSRDRNFARPFYLVRPKWTDEMTEVMGKAKRSFKAHCERHPAAREFARLALEDPTYRDGRRFIRDCLN